MAMHHRSKERRESQSEEAKPGRCSGVRNECGRLIQMRKQERVVDAPQGRAQTIDEILELRCAFPLVRVPGMNRNLRVSRLEVLDDPGGVAESSAFDA